MWLVALTWFLLLGSIGFSFPYFGLYLLEVAKLSGTETGIVLAVVPAMSIIFQPILAAASDRSGARTRILAGLALAASVGLMLIFVARGFWEILLCTALFAACSVALAPGLWAVSFALTAPISPRAMGYGRAAGTVGFGIAVVGFPRLQPWLESPTAAATGVPFLAWTLPFAAAAMFLTAFALAALPRQGEVSVRASLQDLLELGNNRPFRRLLIVMFLAFFGLHGPILFLPVLAQSEGGRLLAISHMWLSMLALEVPLVLALGWSVAKLGVRTLILLGLVTGSVRWLLSAWLTDLTWLSLIQALNGVTLWGTILGGAAYADDEVAPGQRSTAQSLVAVVGAGLGGTCSALLCGWLVEHVGPKAPALWGGVFTLVLAVGVWWFLPESKARRGSAA